MKFNIELEDVKYIKLLCSDSNGDAVVLKAALKSINNREFVSCVKYEDDFSVPANQEIIMSIVCNDGLYRTKTRLKSVYIEEPYIIIVLEAPQGLEYQQNREYFRVSGQYNCAYYVYEGEKVMSFTGQTFDISANGVSIILPVHAFSEEDAEIDIMIDGRTVHSKIKYVRSEKLEDGYKLSFSYSQIKPADRDYISQICIKKQLEQRRNSIKD